MITIFDSKDIENIEEIVNNEEIWSFPINELDYLLEVHKGEDFILYNGRLYEKEVE